MTTEIIVKAHCGEDKQVRITIINTTFETSSGYEGDPESYTLQDGESKDSIYVFDNREITIREVEKS